MYNIPRFVDKLLYYFIAFVKCHLKHAKRLLRFLLLIQILSAIFQCSKYHKSISMKFVLIPHLLDILLLEQILILKLFLTLVFVIEFSNVVVPYSGSAVVGIDSHMYNMYNKVVFNFCLYYSISKCCCCPSYWKCCYWNKFLCNHMYSYCYTCSYFMVVDKNTNWWWYSSHNKSRNEHQQVWSGK